MTKKKTKKIVAHEMETGADVELNVATEDPTEEITEQNMVTSDVSDPTYFGITMLPEDTGLVLGTATDVIEISNKAKLQALIDSAPVIPQLVGPKLDPRRQMNIYFKPQYKLFLAKLGELTECL